MSTESYLKYKYLSSRLHELISDGQGDSDEADELRYLMDPLWESMTDAERDFARNHSAKLWEEKKNEPDKN